MNQKMLNNHIREFKERSQEFRERLNEKRDSNAEYQRRSSMNKQERAKEAIERLTAGRKTFNDYKSGGKDTSYSQAERDVAPVVKKYLRDNGLE